MANFTNKMNENKIKGLFIALQEQNIEMIQIDFAGSGDSGNIDDKTYYDADNMIVKDITDEQDSLMEDIADHILSSHYQYDWYNNDGGGGKLTINLKEKSWTIDGYQYEVQRIDNAQSGELMNIIDDLS